jgi:xylulokinase
VTLVAGVDSSTQSTKVVIRDAVTGALVRAGRAPHPPGTEVHPDVWWDALEAAVADAGGMRDVSAVAVAGQQHGMVCLDDDGEVVRPALLWNDTRSAGAADDLVAELGPEVWAEAVGSVPVASFTVTKLRWLAEHEPASARRVAAVCLPHDWLTWKLRGSRDLHDLVTDRGDASGTGYWSPALGTYRDDLVERAFGRVPLLPRVAEPSEAVGATATGALLAPGTGDNMAAALGVGATLGDVIVSIGTSGVVSAPSARPATDPSGSVAGFADATGAFLPLACTLNAAGVLDAVAHLLGRSLDELAALALSAPPGSDGLVLVPYLAGERTPNLPLATGALHGLTDANTTAAHVARAAVEGVLCSLHDAQAALAAQGVEPQRVLLVGGGARSEAVRTLAPTILGVPVHVPAPGEYVADGAARQAAWALAPDAGPPRWSPPADEVRRGDHDPAVVDRYHEACARILDRPSSPEVAG